MKNIKLTLTAIMSTLITTLVQANDECLVVIKNRSDIISNELATSVSLLKILILCNEFNNYLIRQDLRPFLINVRPDPTAGQIIVGAVSPESIKDPKLRKTYIDKIKRNEDRKNKQKNLYNIRKVLHIELDRQLNKIQWDTEEEKKLTNTLIQQQKETMDLILNSEMYFSEKYQTGE